MYSTKSKENMFVYVQAVV